MGGKKTEVRKWSLPGNRARLLIAPGEWTWYVVRAEGGSERATRGHRGGVWFCGVGGGGGGGGFFVGKGKGLVSSIEKEQKEHRYLALLRLYIISRAAPRMKLKDVGGGHLGGKGGW